MSPLLDVLKKVGSRYAFELFLEVFHEDIVGRLSTWLAPLSAEKVKRMVRKSQYPDFALDDFAKLTDFAEYLEKVSPDRLFDAIVEARPDLAEVIAGMGVKGAKYMVHLREHLLERVRAPELALAKSKEYSLAPPLVEMAMAICDNCHKEWPVPKAEFGKIEVCPFCGHGKNEETPPQED